METTDNNNVAPVRALGKGKGTAARYTEAMAHRDDQVRTVTTQLLEMLSGLRGGQHIQVEELFALGRQTEHAVHGLLSTLRSQSRAAEQQAGQR